MKKAVALMVAIFTLQMVNAQYTLRLIVSDAPSKDLDDWYVSGSFNNWAARQDAYKLKPYGNKRKAIVLKDLPAGKYEFKFSRGSWDKGESSANGTDIENRKVELTTDTTITCKIAGWKDDYPDKVKPQTATAQVKIIDTAFAMPQLNRKRRIWVYLPKGYAASKKAYPVLYMQDGQNLFNEFTAAFGEWHVDETLDTLQPKINKECIVVGIDNGGEKRVTEYNPYDNKFGKGEGVQYVQFLIETLKPFIDKKFRTLKDQPHTSIAGSSMGGLISFYAALKHPDVFGTAGVFSPSFWMAPSIYDEAKNAPLNSKSRFYFYAGGKESETMVKELDKMVDIINSKTNTETRRIVAPLAQHNEKAWQQEFGDFYKWLMQ